MVSANARTRLILNRVVHIKRKLPGDGEIMVSSGMEVTPSDMLARYFLKTGFSVLNLAKELGVSPLEAPKYLQRKIGERIYRGEVLALKNSLLGDKKVISPTDAYLDGYNQNTGLLRLRYLSKESTLISGVFGVVDLVDKVRGEILVKTLVSEVFGVYGSGGQREGFIHVLGNRENLTDKGAINANMGGNILVIGALIYKEALRRALQVGVVGVIAGGFNADDFRSMVKNVHPMRRVGSDIGISTLATEGFGPIAMGSDIYELLKLHNTKFGFIVGNSGKLLLPSSLSDSIIAIRKVALPIIQRPEGIVTVASKAIEIGSRVRLIWPPFMGLQGQVTDIDQSPTTCASGISTYFLTVDTTRRKLKVPYPNVELIS